MTEATELQLDRAEFDEQQPAAACAMCANPLTHEYYEVNGSMVCSTCRGQLHAGPELGTRSGRALRAFGAGALAALGGSLLYWAILALTGYEFGLIAVVVGFAVGKAVNWGSRGKGGWRYQTMAMALTYLAMVSAYVPLIIAEIGKQPAAQTDLNGAETSPATSGAAGSIEPAIEEDPTLSGFLMGLALFVAFVCAIPFLAGIENILGLLILGFGLYEAWKLNRRVDLVITGPHTIAAVEPA